MSPDSPTLIVLMGLPSSGKSTLARLLSYALIEKFRKKKVVIIGTDDIRRLFPNQLEHFDPDLEPLIKEITHKIIGDCLKNRFLVINDDMNYYKSMRHELRQIATENRAHFVLIHIQISLELALEWNRKRGLPIPQKVIKTVNERFDIPGDYHWDLPIATIKSNELASDEPIEQILTNLMPILSAPYRIPEENIPSAPNIREQIDKLTRDRVAEVAKSISSNSLLKKISKFRINYLKNIAENNLSLEKTEKDFQEQLMQFMKQLKRAK